MATTPTTSIGSSYQRLGGSTPVITQGTPGPQLSAATKERLKLEEERKLNEERVMAERIKQANRGQAELKSYYNSEAEKTKNMSPFQLGQYQSQKDKADIQRQREYQRGMSGGR